MKKNKYLFLTWLVLLFSVTLITSCHKDEEDKPTMLSEPVDRFKAVVGTWQQTDVQFAVDVDKDNGMTAGASLVETAPLLGVALGLPGFGKQMRLSQLNTLTINEDRSYSFDNPINSAYFSLLMPNAGASGTWDLTVHHGVLQLTSNGGEPDPHWIDKLTENSLSLSIILSAGGNDIPLYVFYERKTEDESNADQRLQWLNGDWVEKDVQFGMTIPEAALGMEIPEGTSLIEMAPLLGLALGDPDLADHVQFTRLNTFSFNNGSYSFDNPLDDALVGFLLPEAGVAGDFDVTAFGSALQLAPDGGGKDVHLINDMTENTISIGTYIDVPGVGTLPFNVILEKSAGNADIQQKMQWLTGAWEQEDLKFAMDLPKDALGMAIPKGTSVPELIQNPDVAAQLGDDAVLGIQLMASTTYSFNTDRTYSFTNPIGGSAIVEALFPAAGESGNWGLLGGASVVLPLIPSGSSSPDLHWINALTEDLVNLRVSLSIGGTSIPLNLVLKRKEKIEPQFLTGTWNQDDLQFAIDVPKDALGMPIPEGTSILDLVADPNVAAALGSQAVQAIQATAASTYTFNADNTYSFINPVGGAQIIGLLFPNEVTPGRWEFTQFMTALQLTPNGGSANTYAIEKTSGDKLTMNVSLSIPGVATVPMNLILKKQ